MQRVLKKLIHKTKPAVKASLIGREHGFTFVEMLTALSIFSLVGLATLAIMQRAVTSRKVTRQKTAALMQQQQAITAISVDLDSAQPFTVGPFRGYADSLRFTILRPSSEYFKIVQYVAYFLKRDEKGEGYYLMRSTSDFKGSTAAEKILSDVESMELQYLPRLKTEAQWQDHWSEADQLPLAVRIHILLTANSEPIEIICPIRSDGKNRKQNQGALSTS